MGVAKREERFVWMDGRNNLLLLLLLLKAKAVAVLMIIIIIVVVLAIERFIIKWEWNGMEWLER